MNVTQKINLQQNKFNIKKKPNTPSFCAHIGISGKNPLFSNVSSHIESQLVFKNDAPVKTEHKAMSKELFRVFTFDDKHNEIAKEIVKNVRASIKKLRLSQIEVKYFEY